MYVKKNLIRAGAMVALAVLATGAAISAQDKYTLKVPGGLAFSEFKGYESWQTISISHTARCVAVILGNPAMIDAYKAGIPGNGKPFPDGARMAKIHWAPKKNVAAPGAPTVAGTLHRCRFHGEGQQALRGRRRLGICRVQVRRRDRYVHARHAEADKPPQANDAKCGFACHTIAKNSDYVFTEYAQR